MSALRRVCAAEAADALDSQMRRLALPELALPQKLEIKRYTWSQLRDCRGFRARDDVMVRRATLRELAMDDTHEIWGVLARGVRFEVQRVVLRVVPTSTR